LEEYILRQDPQAKDAWVIISSLPRTLQGCEWYRAGLSKKQLAKELRRNSYRSGQTQQWTKVCESVSSWSVPVVGDLVGDPVGDPAPGLVKQGIRTVRVNNVDERRERLTQEVQEYVRKSRVVALRYLKMLLKTGLPKRVVERIMKFLELRVTVATGPVMYCMRCRDYWNLAGLIDHFCNNSVHIDAVAAQSV
jgi:hypothetical protein